MTTALLIHICIFNVASVTHFQYEEFLFMEFDFRRHVALHETCRNNKNYNSSHDSAITSPKTSIIQMQYVALRTYEEWSQRLITFDAISAHAPWRRPR